MAFDAIADSEIDVDSVLDNALMVKFKNRDDFNKSGNASGNADFFEDAYESGHDHSGGAEGANIITAGIATDGVISGTQVGSDAVTNGKIAGTTLTSGLFASGSVTVAKMSGKMGTNLTGSSTSATPHAVAHGLGYRPVVTNQLKTAQTVISSTDATNVWLRGNERILGTPPGLHTWDITVI